VAKLNPPLVDGGYVSSDFEIDPFLNRVVYIASQEVANHEELYGVPIAGGPAVKLNPPGWRVGINNFALNPQLQVVVFRARNGFDPWHLYMNATSGGLLTPLNYPLASNESVIGFHISPDGARVVYNVAAGTPTSPFPNRGNLYSVLIGGGDSTLLTTSTDPGWGILDDNFNITADGQRVVYLYQTNGGGGNGVLESAALTGDNRVILSAAGSTVFYVSPNGQWVIYNHGDELYAKPTTGGAPLPLEIGDYQGITPDSGRVLVTSSRLSGNTDLYSISFAGTELRNLSRLPGGVKAGSDPIISPDSQWIVFPVDYSAGSRELRVSDGAEAQPAPPPGYPVYLPIIVR
jgi:Tol biopolymer transport system component